MATQYNNINNPQQNPVYQRWWQQNQGTTSDQSGQQSSTPQNPYATTNGGYGIAQVPGEDSDQNETFLQRLARRKSDTSTTQGQQTPNPGAAPNLQAPSSVASPVQANGRLSTQSAPIVQGLTPGAPPAAAPAPAAPQPIPVSHNAGNQTYGVPDDPKARDQFFAHLTIGTPVAGNPGATWGYQNGSWVVMPAGSQAGQPAPAQPGPPLNTPNNANPAFTGSALLPANATYYADNLGNSPFATYGGYQFSQQGLPTYQAGQLNVNLPQAYQAGQIGQFQGPDQTQTDQATQALINQILQNPLSMSDANVNALKEKQKESALAMQQQALQQAGQNAASRGLSLGSGQLETQQRRAADATQANLLGSYRDIDLAKMQQDQADRLNAANAGNSFLTSQLQRATGAYGAQLSGQQAQEGANQAQAQSGMNLAQLQSQIQQANLDQLYKQYQSQAANRQFGFGVEQAQAGQNQAAYQSQLAAQQQALQRAIAQSGINQTAAQSGLAGYNAQLGALQQQQGNATSNRQLDIQQLLGQLGIGVDQAKLAETGREFDKGYNLDYLRYLLGQSQFNDQMGLAWTQLNNQSTNSLLSQL